MTDATPVLYTAETVTNIMKTANDSYRVLKAGMDIMDRNILNDMQILFDKQQDTIDAINALASNVSLVSVPKGGHKIPKVRIALAIGLGTYAGIMVHQAIQSKKGRK